MKIYSMTATFGKLEHTTLTLQPGLNLIEAPNEWGKSTWCAFLSAMLYGIETRVHSTKTALADKERYAPWSGSPMAGRIDLHWNGRDITIERRTKGRAIFGDFKAYETASGIAVPELTADNCGKLLLGVEKSVFLRTGFIRLSDMPVTQDEALRRRLNELVTTGDESGQSDDLAQKLRDLKNRCRSNRANGLIPQALAQKADLEAKLRQLDELQARSQQAKQRQAQTAELSARLQNHKQTLAWQNASQYAQKAAQAKAQLEAVQDQVQRLEAQCQQLPSEEVLLKQQHQARQLQIQKDNLQLELAMLCAPTPPAAALHTPEQVQKDFAAYQKLSTTQPARKGQLVGYMICGGNAFLCGLLMVLLRSKPYYLPTGLVFMAIATAFMVVDLLRYSRKSKAFKQAQALRQELEARYAPLPPEDWLPAAHNAARQQEEYAAKQAAFEAQRTRLQQALQDVCVQLAAFPATDGHSDALAQRRALTDARREQQHLTHLVQTLERPDILPKKPSAPDDLTYSEAETARLLSDAELESRQLHKLLGQLEGQMQSLGSRESLESQLADVNHRLARLEQTYAALEIAQNTLSEAATALQRRFAPAIARQARDYFSHITGSRYDRLTLDNALGLHAAAANEDTLTSSLWRSDGTVDQLYLALRLAVADALTPEAPLVLDDALVRFDDTRLGAAVELLKQAAARRQVILFTCQSRERVIIDNGQWTIDN